MGFYKNFELATYFIAHGTKEADRERLEQEIAFFEKHLHLDRVYLEPYRGGDFATEAQVRMVKEVFEAHGIRVAGGITPCAPQPEGTKKKARLFDTICYNDKAMTDRLSEAAALCGRVFDEFIIDDFFFTNCTCEDCRREKDAFNAEHGITDGSWQNYRVAKLYQASKDFIIGPAKRENPDCRVIIKYPNWMESYQETGYDPASQKEIFDGIYTGTETRDPRHTDQHLPRYLSFSLMRYMEAMLPGGNGGGWFDPYDCPLVEQYLEQAYLTAFSKPRELMMFCFQSLYDNLCIPTLGFMLDKLDALLSHLGDSIGTPCYIPNASQGEDNIQDFLGMHGFPILPVPQFPENAKRILLTASSAYDPDIMKKTERFVAAGGKAIVTPGFVKATLDRGLKGMTSIRDGGRRIRTDRFSTAERWDGVRDLMSEKPLEFSVLELRNNATWGALCKAVVEEESYSLLLRDTYGDGELVTLNLPDAFGQIKYLPERILMLMRREMSPEIYLEGGPQVSLFLYDNDTFVLYPYNDRFTQDQDMLLHIAGNVKLEDVESRRKLDPLFVTRGESVFSLRMHVGKWQAYRICRD